MSLISKICLVFLGWIIVGLLLYIGSAFYWFVRGFFLDPYNKGFGREFASDCIEAMYESVGIKYVPKEERCEFEDHETREGFAESVTQWAINGMLWPVTTAAVMTGFGNTYKRYKDEYDRGIRTRKEPS